MPYAGSTPLGYYVETVEDESALPVPILADYIDPDTGDIIRLNEGRMPIDAAIIEGIRVDRGTGAAVLEVGQTLRKVRHTDETSLAEIPTRARDGVEELERQGLVRFESVVGPDLNPKDESSASYTAYIRDLTVSASDPASRIERRLSRF